METIEKVQTQKTVQLLFNEFIAAVKEGNSFITNDSEVFTKENIDNVKKCFLDNPIGSAEGYRKGDWSNMNKLALEIANLKGKKEPDFQDKIEKQFEELPEKTKILFSNLLWLRHLPIADISIDTKMKNTNFILSNKPSDLKIDFPNGIANYRIQRQNIYDDMKYLSEMFHSYFNPDGDKKENKEVLNDFIVMFCNNKIEKSACIRNMLLSLCNPDYYESIAANNIKEKIVGNMLNWAIKTKNDNSTINMPTVDTKIAFIRDVLKNDSKYKSAFDINGKRFFDRRIEKLWKNDSVADAYEILTTYQQQIILYGAPGTGKTYNAKKVIGEFIDNTKNCEEIKDKLKKGRDGKDEKYDYSKILFSKFEEKKKDPKIGFSLENNKEFSQTPVVWEIVQFNQTYSYEDFIEGLVPIEGNKIEPKSGIFKRFVEAAENNTSIDFIMIIDEINRGKIDKIFGELLYLLEYREESVRLHYSQMPFKISNNVYIIGTMNTADKSIAALDVALRRRFWFVKCEADIEILKEKFDEIALENDESKAVLQIALKLFILLNGTSLIGKENRHKGLIENALGSEASELKIGHSYFLKLLENVKDKSNVKAPSFDDLKNIWFFYILPLLEEYCNFDKDALSKLFNGVIDLSIKSNFTLENLKKMN